MEGRLDQAGQGEGAAAGRCYRSCNKHLHFCIQIIGGKTHTKISVFLSGRTSKIWMGINPPEPLRKIITENNSHQHSAYNVQFIKNAFQLQLQVIFHFQYDTAC